MSKRGLLLLVAMALTCFGASPSAPPPARQDTTQPAVVITVDSTQVPEMADWAKSVQRVADAEYPKLAALLASDGFVAPAKVRIVIDKDMKGVAATSGDTVHMAASYFKAHPEDLGAVVHELAHVVQHYGGRGEKPGWLVEGVADWARFYHYEPVRNQPVIDAKTADYRKGYRQAAAFLQWIEGKFGPGVVVKINAALRAGTYREGIFADLTGKGLEELWKEYVGTLQGAPATRGK